MPVDEEKRESTGCSQTVLDVRPGRRRVFAVFLRSQGNGGPFWHLFRGTLLRVAVPAFRTKANSLRTNPNKYRFQICDLQRLSRRSRKFAIPIIRTRGAHLSAKHLIGAGFRCPGAFVATSHRDLTRRTSQAQRPDCWPTEFFITCNRVPRSPRLATAGDVARWHRADHCTPLFGRFAH